MVRKLESAHSRRKPDRVRVSAHLAAHGKRIDATNEQVDLILILYATSRAMQVGNSWLEKL